jgi:hypothetical protein
VVTGLDDGLRAALALLDGTRDHDQVLTAATALGCPPDRTAVLLDLLGSSGLLDDAGRDRAVLADLDRDERERLAADVESLALVRGDGGLPALEHRRAARVLVVGAGRVGAVVAMCLAVSGVGEVDVSDDSPARPQDTGVGGLALQDVGRSRGEAARERLRAQVPSLPGREVTVPDLVVLAPARSEHLDTAAQLVRDGTAHLLAEVRGATGVVGPLVLPGRTACLRCLDLTRSDLDPVWPALAAQLGPDGRDRQACDMALAVQVAGQAAQQVLAMLDGTVDPATLGGTLEMTLPDHRWRRRTWPVHADCGCAGAPSAEAVG